MISLPLPANPTAMHNRTGFTVSNRNFWRKIKMLALICVFTSLAGILFQLVNESRLDVSSVLFGFPLGLAFGLLELFAFPKLMHLGRWPFTKVLVFKTILYTATIYVATVPIMYFVGLSEGR